MSIRTPIELAAAAIVADSAVDSVPAAPGRQATFASSPCDLLADVAEPIRLAAATPPASVQKRIPGQTYH